MFGPTQPRLDGGIEKPKPAFAGFGMRAAAFVVDLVLVYFAGYTLNLGARDALLAVGPLLPLATGALVFAYFWLGNGPVGRGQTVGKALLNLRTARADGSPLSLGDSLKRSALQLTILYGAIFASIRDAFDLPYAVAFHGAQFIQLFALTFLFAHAYTVFAHPRRQGWHDLWAGSFTTPDPPGREFRDTLDAEPTDEDRLRLSSAFKMSVVFFLLINLLMIGRWSISLFDWKLREEFSVARAVQTARIPDGYRLVHLTIPPIEVNPSSVENAPGGLASNADLETSGTMLAPRAGEPAPGVLQLFFKTRSGMLSKTHSTDALVHSQLLAAMETASRAYAGLPSVMQGSRRRLDIQAVILMDIATMVTIPVASAERLVGVRSYKDGFQSLDLRWLTPDGEYSAERSAASPAVEPPTAAPSPAE